MKKIFLALLLVPSIGFASGGSNNPSFVTVNSTGPIAVSGSFTAQPSTATVPVGFVSGTSTVTVSASNPFPISGSFTANASTASVPTGFLSGVSTITVSATNPLPVSGSFSFTPPAVTTVTFNGASQPVNVLASTMAVTNVSGQNLNVTASNTGFNVNNSPTVVQSTAAVNGSTIAVVNAVGTTLQVAGSFTATASTVTVPIGFINPTSTVTVSLVNPLPVHDTGTINVMLTTSTYKVGNVDFYATGGTIFSTVTINTSATGTTVIVSTVSTQFVFVYRMFFDVGGSSTTIQIKSGNGFSFSGPMKFNDGGSFVVDFQGDPWFVCDASSSFEITQTGTAQISGRVYYLQGTTFCTGGVCSATSTGQLTLGF